MRKQIEAICRALMVSAVSAKVISVDQDAGTCDVKPITGGADILDVRLRVDDGNIKGHIIYPEVGSLVLVAPIDNDNAHYYVAMFSEVAEVRYLIDDTRLIADKNGVIIAKGGDGLREVLTELVTQILKIYAPMDKPGLIAIQKRIKNLLKDA